MSAEHYDMCCNRIGEAVKVQCHDGTVHYGYIDRVDRQHLYLRPMDGADGDGFDGPGTFLWGWGLGFGIAWATIAAIAFAPFFWW